MVWRRPRCGSFRQHAEHGNAAGSSRYGGVLVIAGDDHAGEDSRLFSSSIRSYSRCLNDSGVESSRGARVLDFGLHGWAMSRYCGCWVAMKAISDTVENYGGG